MTHLAFIDGGGTARGPSSQAQTHVVAPGETLAVIADRFGVQPQVLRAANPQIFQDPSARRRDNAENGGDVMLSGDVLTIPVAAQSVTTDEPLTSDYNPIYASPNGEVSVNAQGSNSGASYTWNPGDGTVKLTVSQQAGAEYEHRPTPFGIPDGNANGVTLEAKVRGEQAQTKGFNNKDGNTEVIVEWDTSIVASVSAEADGRGIHELGVERSVGAGFQSRYKVTLPGENRKPEDATTINPYDPTTIPKGVTVTMDSQDYTSNGMSGTFEHIGFETSVKQASGTSYSVTRVDDDSVRVTMGPNEAVEAFNGFGLNTDIATVMLGRQDGLGSSTVRTATFDLSNKDGQAAYSHFVASGEVAHETAGVSDVATIERVDYSSQTRLKLGLGPEALNVQADLAGPQNTGAFVKTTYPDGSYAYTTNLQYSGNVPLQVVQRFDTSGAEVISERTYTFQVKGGSSEAFHIDEAWSGEFRGHGPAQAGQTITLTFSEEQMRQLVGQTNATIGATADEHGQPTSASLDLQSLVGGYDGAPSTDTLDFAINLVRNLGSGDPLRFAETLSLISEGADGTLGRDSTYTPISMTVDNS